MDKQEFYNKIKEYADNRSLTCELKDSHLDCADWCVEVSKKESDGWLSWRNSCTIHIKERGNGMYSHWYESYSGYKSIRHISGPGYKYPWLKDEPTPLEGILKNHLYNLQYAI